MFLPVTGKCSVLKSLAPFLPRFTHSQSDVFGGVMINPFSVDDLPPLRPVLELSGFFKSMKKTPVTTLTSGVSAVQLPGVLDSNSPTPGVLYIREFYPRLFAQLWTKRWSVLTGNPGISKSWFQWYIMYQLAKEAVQEPRVILRQCGSVVQYYFCDYDVVYFSDFVPSIFFLFKPECTLYLYEPRGLLQEPVGSRFKTIATCSPNRRHYKEFCKNGAIKFYMPCWTLNEIKAVGAHVASNRADMKDFYSPEEIEKRFEQFGGIIRYVLPPNQKALNAAKREQQARLHSTKRFHFAVGQDIEKTDDMKENISHHILQYNVKYHGPEGSFTSFSLVSSSKFVTEYMKNQVLSVNELDEAVRRLQLMLIGAEYNENLFEAVVSSCISQGKLNCEVYENESWVKHDFGKMVLEHLPKEEEDVSKMKPGCLYSPADPKFPLVDFIYVKEDIKKNGREVFSIQVTKANRHSKPLTTHRSCLKRLGLDEKKDTLHIYVACDPHDAEKYAKASTKSFYSKLGKAKPLNNVHYHVIRIKWT